MTSLRQNKRTGRIEASVPDSSLVAKKFGRLKVLGICGKASNGSAVYDCVCECGNKTRTRKNRLLSGETTSCGCAGIVDLRGKKIGRLTVIRPAGKTKCGNYKWECLCDCGKAVVVKSGSLTRDGGTKSCGCLHSEICREIKTTHGLTGHPLYNVWLAMKGRCADKADLNYGARGISVCDEWIDDFKPFYEFAMRKGWRHGLDIDRIITNGNYEPENCRFVTRTINTENTRTAKWWVIGGVKYPSARKAAVHEGVNRETILRWCGVVPWRGGEKRNKPGCYSYLKY